MRRGYGDTDPDNGNCLRVPVFYGTQYLSARWSRARRGSAG